MKCKDESQISLLIGWITDFGLRTGTSEYGPFTKESDYDYVMTEKEVIKMAKTIGIDPSMANCQIYGRQFMSFKYRFCEFHKWTNLIVVPDDLALQVWKLATNVMKQLEPIEDRKERHFQFGRLLNSFFMLHGANDRAVWPDKKTIEIEQEIKPALIEVQDHFTQMYNMDEDLKEKMSSLLYDLELVYGGCAYEPSERGAGIAFREEAFNEALEVLNDHGVHFYDD